MKCNVADVLKKAKEKLTGLAVGTEERKQIEDVVSTLAMIDAVKNGGKLASVPLELETSSYSKTISKLTAGVNDLRKYVDSTTSAGNVWGMRGKGGALSTFGNPFSRYTVGSTEDGELSAMYYEWLNTGAVPRSYNGDKKELLTARNNVLANIWQIKNVLDGKKKIYYRGTAQYKELSHVLALLYYVKNSYDKVDTTNITPTTANVYFSTKENAILSNLYYRPFTYNGVNFVSVEHAYQSLKNGKGLDKDVYNDARWGTVVAGKAVKVVGKSGTKIANNWNVDVLMRKLLEASFAQNPEATKALLETGNKTITHTQDSGVWRNELPRLLMQLRDKLVTSDSSTGTAAVLVATKNSIDETKDEAIAENDSNEPKTAGNAAKLNSDQQTAYNKISSMLNSKTQHTFLLEGAAGTGKSFTLGQIIADAADRKKTEILLGAVAHTAKDNLYFMAKEYVTETARLEAVVAVQMKQRLIEKANNALLSQVEANIILVVDEVSMMLNKDIDDLTEIVNNINSTNPYVTVKMIMLGDRAQLRPIVVDVNYVNGAGSVKVEGVSLSGSRKVVNNKDMFVFDMKENSTTDTALKLVRSTFGENADGTVSAEIRNDNGWLKLVIPNKNKLRGKVFNTMSKDAAHMLTKQMRNITSTARLINMFREEAVESVWDAENSSKYKDKLFSALNAVKNDRETGNGNEFIGQGQKLSDTSIQDLLDGRASVLTAANKSATTINNTITKAVANKMGKIVEYEQYGMFVGQPLAMRVNTAEDVKNNAKVVVKELRLVGDSAYNIYDNHLAASFIGPISEDAKVLAIMFTKTKVATVAADTGTVDILALGADELESIVKTPQTFAEFASSNIKVIVQINKMPIPVPVDYNVALLAAKKLSVEERMSILTPAAPTYAFTIHKSQGMTMPRALVIDTMSFNPSLTAVQKLELLYVGLSRSSGNVAILQGRDVANSIADQVTTYLQKDESMLQGDRLSQNMVILDNSKAEEVEEALACKNKGK